MNSVLTGSLRSTLNSDNNNKNITEPQEEEKEAIKMAKLNEKIREQQKKRNTEATEGLGTTTTEDALNSTGTEGADNVNATSTDVEDELKGLIDGADSAEADSNTSGSEGEDLTKTSHFTTGGNGGNPVVNTDKTVDEAEKAAKKAEREKNIAEYNDKMNKWMSELEGKTSDINDFSEKQKSFQVACELNFRANGFVVLQDAAPELAVKRTYLTVDKEPKLKATANITEYETWKTADSATKKATPKGSFIESQAEFVLKYNKPKKPIGAIISMPLAANIPFEKFQSEDFNVDPDEFKASKRVQIVVSYDAFFVYTMLYCGGVMREADYMNSSDVRFQRSIGEQMVKASYEFRKVTKSDSTVDHTIVKAVKPVNRNQLLVKENIIPITRFKTAKLSPMSGETLEAYKKKVSGLLSSKPKDDSVFSILKPAHQTTVDVTVDNNEPNKVVVNNLKFATSQMFGRGTGELSNVTLSHWSNVSNNNGKPKASVIADPIVVDLHFAKKADGQLSEKPSKIKEQFSVNYTLETLEREGYTAAKQARIDGITEGDISKIYTDYAIAEKARKTEEAASKAQSTGRTSTVRRSNIVTNDQSSKLLLAAITSSNTKVTDNDLSLNASSVADSIRRISFTYGTKSGAANKEE